MTATERSLGFGGRVAMLVLFIAGAVIATPSGFGLFWFIPFAGVGALVVIRRPRTSIGWILFGLAWSFALVTVAVDATAQQFADGTVGFATALFAVVQSTAGTIGFFLFALLAIVYPSGRLPVGRWGWISRLGLGICLVLIAASFVMPVIAVNLVGMPESIPVPNPFALWPDHAIWQGLADWQLVTPDTVIIPVILLLAGGAVSLIVRARRADGVERQQLRWLGASIAVVVAAVLSGFVLSILAPEAADAGLVWVPALLTFPLVAVAVGVAVLRYRLYEIDRIISRTIGWALVTGALVAVFAAVVIALQAALSDVTQGQTLAVAASTLVAFAIFQPLRRRVQRTVDRRFDRARYDAEGTTAAFSERLRHEVEIAAVIADLQRTTQASLRPTALSVWVRTPEGVSELEDRR
jgi:hypothetical protein